MNRLHHVPMATGLMIGVCAVAVMLTAATAGAGEGRLSPEAIMNLAREGRNREAIEAFKALPEADKPYPLLLLRAVAGSYWREREFESAHELYNEILKRRPTLQGLVPGEAPVAATAAEAPAEDPAVEEVVAVAEAPAPAVTELQEQDPIAELAGAATDMQGQVDSLQVELTRERESVEELKQWRREREETLEREVEAMAAAAIENALREIETLEQENAALEADGRRRQDELLAQMKTLSGQTTAAETWSRTLLEDLEKEQRLREELQSSEAERLKELDDARFALRTVSSGIVEQLARIHNELVAHKAELRISYEKGREYSDMAPVLNQLEAAAREASEEVATLRKRLDEQQAGLDAERRQHRAAIVKLTERVSELEGRNTQLEEKLADTLKALAEANARTDRMQERVVLLDRVFTTPDGAFDPDMVTGVERVFGFIAAVAETNSPLAIAQFERLPANADVPASLLKTLAGIYRERKDYAAARDLYQRVLAVRPDDLQAERRLIMTLFDMGRYDEALARLSGAKSEDK